MVSIFVFPDFYMFKHPFLYFLDICTFSLVNCLLVFLAHFSICVFSCLFYGFIWILCIFWIPVLSQLNILQIFSSRSKGQIPAQQSFLVIGWKWSHSEITLLLVGEEFGAFITCWCPSLWYWYSMSDRTYQTILHLFIYGPPPLNSDLLDSRGAVLWVISELPVPNIGSNPEQVLRDM